MVNESAQSSQNNRIKSRFVQKKERRNRQETNALQGSSTGENLAPHAFL